MASSCSVRPNEKSVKGARYCAINCSNNRCKSIDPRTLRVPDLISTINLQDKTFDGVIVVANELSKLTGDLEPLKEVIETYSELDAGFQKQPILLQTQAIPSRRLIYSATGPINRDQDDVRTFADATAAGIKRALSAGCKKPLLIPLGDPLYENAKLVSALSALHTVYMPLELRDIGKPPKIDVLGIWNFSAEEIRQAIALEEGRIVARDIGGSDPERMAAPRVEEYLQELFAETSIKMTVISDVPTLNKDYPLMGAVNRASNTVDRHKGRVIFLEYESTGKAQKTLFFVGKGVTYDTGGADVKAGGNMAGMHRDKCGAAAVAGLMKVVEMLKPENVRVVAGLAMVRNSIGEESYVADEIITSRAGMRIRVGNTDAEGRMAMGDVLCHMKELAQDAVNPHLFTVATLTGHAIRAMGLGYSIIMDNGPARKLRNAQSIQEVGHCLGDPFEISSIRREDYEFHKGKSEYEDVLQANNQPSTLTNRGHQGPAAFLIMASGLDKYGVDSSKPLPYTHLDIAASSGPFPGVPQGAPIVAIASHFFTSNQ